ncbi:SagB/ThcOx family dehydrogenase [Actinomadura yumaensis]|uniref:SagB/ThcOx family dehydrogenase n=1 Tax=Actinomadura yumaensis TaxID=111807 RepID=A0ABW2CRX4_9ACTN
MTSPRTDTPTGEPLSVPAGRDAGDPAPGPEPAGAERARLRRARCVVCYWTPAGVFTAHPYPHGHPVALDGPAATVLAAFTDWTTPGQARRMLDGAGHEPARGPGDEFTETVRRLREGGLLLAEHTERAARDADLAARWAPWGPQAPFLHYTTQDFTPPPPPSPPSGPEHTTAPDPGRDADARATGNGGRTGDGSDADARAAAVPAPLFHSHPEADRVLLPRPLPDLNEPFGRVLYRRRTHYAFAPDPVPLETLATLLATVFGPTAFLDAGPHGTLALRTSPSPGALQEHSAYLALYNVEDIEPGWYHYNPIQHSLELRTEGCTRQTVTAACAGQDWVADAAFLVVLAADLRAPMRHNPDPRSYRVTLLSAGHLGQTFALTATALGLAPFQIAADHDTALAAHLRIDNLTRTPTHLLGAGLPGDRPDPRLIPAGLHAFPADPPA